MAHNFAKPANQSFSPNNFNYNYNSIYNGMNDWWVADSSNTQQFQITEGENVAFQGTGVCTTYFSDPYVQIYVPATLSSYTNDAGFIGEAPYDGNKYARQYNAWTTVSDGATGSNGADGINSGLRYSDGGSYGSGGGSYWDGSSTLYVNRYDVNGADNYTFLSSLQAGCQIIYHTRVGSSGYLVLAVSTVYWNGSYFQITVSNLGGSGSVNYVDVGIDFILLGPAGAAGTNGKYISCQAPLYEVTGTEIGIYKSDGADDGYLSSTDWNIFNAKLDDAPNDGTMYARLSGGWSNVVAGYVGYSATAAYWSGSPMNLHDAVERIANLLSAGGASPIP